MLQASVATQSQIHSYGNRSMEAIAILWQSNCHCTQIACNDPKCLHFFFHISCSLMSNAFLNIAA